MCRRMFGGCNGLTRTEPSWWCWCPCKRFGPREKRTVRVGEVPTVGGLELECVKARLTLVALRDSCGASSFTG